MLKISETDIAFIKPQGGLIGFASFVVNGGIFLSGIGIHRKLGGGYRLTYPNRKTETQVFDVFHPISQKAAQVIEDAVFSKLKDVMKERNHDAGHHSSQVA